MLYRASLPRPTVPRADARFFMAETLLPAYDPYVDTASFGSAQMLISDCEHLIRDIEKLFRPNYAGMLELSSWTILDAACLAVSLSPSVQMQRVFAGDVLEDSDLEGWVWSQAEEMEKNLTWAIEEGNYDSHTREKLCDLRATLGGLVHSVGRNLEDARRVKQYIEQAIHKGEIERDELGQVRPKEAIRVAKERWGFLPEPLLRVEPGTSAASTMRWAEVLERHVQSGDKTKAAQALGLLGSPEAYEKWLEHPWLPSFDALRLLWGGIFGSPTFPPSRKRLADIPRYSLHPDQERLWSGLARAIRGGTIDSKTVDGVEHVRLDGERGFVKYVVPKLKELGFHVPAPLWEYHERLYAGKDSASDPSAAEVPVVDDGKRPEPDAAERAFDPVECLTYWIEPEKNKFRIRTRTRGGKVGNACFDITHTRGKHKGRRSKIAGLLMQLCVKKSLPDYEALRVYADDLGAYRDAPTEAVREAIGPLERNLRSLANSLRAALKRNGCDPDLISPPRSRDKSVRLNAEIIRDGVRDAERAASKHTLEVTDELSAPMNDEEDDLFAPTNWVFR